MKLFGDIFQNKSVLLTGHTGFKGSWLAYWLTQLGARVTGVSLSPETTPNHWDLLGLNIDDRRLDIRNFDQLLKVFGEIQPEIVFHLAAQPLVRRSYGDPLSTWSTNVMGTANILEACRLIDSVRAIIVVTTDKCYENQEWLWGYRESDRLGGHDPYSASKAGAEILASSYRDAFFRGENSALLATARAGNVIGGGDWSEDRLIPDLVRSIEAGKILEIRSPNSTRPWQHVLESLSGYLMLGQRLLEGSQRFAVPWNFGPRMDDNRSVIEILNILKMQSLDIHYLVSGDNQYHEATLLHLDSTKAYKELGWKPVWEVECALRKTADWYQAWLKGGNILTLEQLNRYISDAALSGAIWVSK